MWDWPAKGKIREHSASPRDALRDSRWRTGAAHPVHGEAVHSGEEVKPVMRAAMEVSRACWNQRQEMGVLQPREQGSRDSGHRKEKAAEALKRELAPRRDGARGKTVHEDRQLPARPGGGFAIGPSSSRHNFNPARTQVGEQGVADLGRDAALELGRRAQ